MKLKVYGGKTDSEVEISKVLTDAKMSEAGIAQVIKAHLANLRESNAHAKNRGEVRGGGRKPWRQKGTGRARAGSSRSPIWIGGGVTFGPRNNRNYKQRLNQKMSNLALKVALAEKIKDKKFIITKSLDFPEIGTKQMQSYLEKLPIEEGRILVILPKTNVNLELSAANLGYIKTIQAAGIKLLDVLKHNYILTDQDGLKALEDRFTEKKVK